LSFPENKNLWLGSTKSDAEAFLLGDLFDFWFEYKTVPKGFIRVLGKLAEL
jgi:UDP-2,3-diacylglucosamine hydrolase